MQKQNIFKVSLLSFKSVEGISLSAMLVAMSCVLGFFKFGVGQNVNVTFFFIPIFIGAILLGPIPAAIIGGAADILGCIIRPTGPYFPGFTINAIILGLIYGIFFFKTKPKLWKIIIARLILAVLVDLILTPIWLNILYSTPLVPALFVERLIKCAILCPIEIILMWIISGILTKLKINKI